MKAPGGVLALALLVAHGCGACSSYVGFQGFDAAVGASTDAAPAADQGLPGDASPCYWNADWGCSPYDPASCGPDLTCVVTAFDPIAPRSTCMPAGSLPTGSVCADASPETRCARGLVCLRGRCLAGCCGALDDARCGAHAAGSTCAVPTQSLRVWGCTLPGACDYRAPNCGPQRACVPTGLYGSPVCVGAGDGTDNAPCSDDNACAVPFTCLISFPASVGRCRPRCNPRGPTSPCAGRCLPFADRPADFGACG